MTPIWAWARRELDPSPPRRGGARAAHRRQRRGRAHDARPALAAVHPPTTASSRPATRPTSSCSTGPRRAARTRPSTPRSSRLCEPIPPWTRPCRSTSPWPSPRRRDYDLGIFAGPDPALFTEIDEPRILEGRRPDPSDPHEVLINRFTQENLGVEVGDTVTVQTFSAEQFGARTTFAAPAGPTIPMEIVGHRGDCVRPGRPGVQWLLRHRRPSTRSTGERWAASGPPSRSPPTLVTTSTPSSTASSRTSSLEEVFVSERSDQAEKVEDGTRVLAVGLAAFALVAGLAALVAGAQALHRRMAETADDLPALRALGLSRTECTIAVVLSSLPVIVAGAGLAVVLAIGWLVLMPIGQARTAEPNPGVDVDVLVLGTRRAAARAPARCERGLRRACAPPGSAWPDRRATPRRPAASLFASGHFAPSSQLGVAMALDPGEGRTSVPVRSAIVGAAFGVAGRRRGSDLRRRPRRPGGGPASSGWNWTLAPDLARGARPERRCGPSTASRTSGSSTSARCEAGGRAHDRRLDAGGAGRAVVHRRARPHAVRSPRGRARSEDRRPARPRHRRSRHRRGSRAAPDGEREAVVVGEVLMPTMDDNAFNEGIAHDARRAGRRRADRRGSIRRWSRFADGIDEDEAARRVRDRPPGGDLGVQLLLTPAGRRQPARRAVPAARARAVPRPPRHRGRRPCARHQRAPSPSRPRGRAVASASSARDVLRALTTQSWTLVAIGLVFGIPLGIALGRVAWQLVAEQIGVRASAPHLAARAAGRRAGRMRRRRARSSVPPGVAAARQRSVDALRVE